MAQDVIVRAEQVITPGGSITNLGWIPTQASGTVQTLVNGNTIAVGQNQSVVRITAAGAVTGIILAAGLFGGQMLTVINEAAAANTATMAAAGTSNVAGGVTVSLSGLAAHIFVWDSVTALWYQVGPATN